MSDPLYIINSPLPGSPAEVAFVEGLSPPTDDFPICPVCNEHIGMATLSRPLRFRTRTVRRAPPDFLIGDRALIASENVIAKLYSWRLILRNQCVPVLILDSAGGQTSRFQEIVVPHLRYQVDIQRSTIKPKRWARCRHCLGGGAQPADHVMLTRSSWNGEHLFQLDLLPNRIIATQTFKDACESFNNIDFNMTRVVMIPELKAE